MKLSNLFEKEFEKPKVTSLTAKKIGDNLGVDWKKVDVSQLAKGISVEMEHGSQFNKDTQTDTDVLPGNEMESAAKVALAHLEEFSDYYDRLEKMEKEAE